MARRRKLGEILVEAALIDDFQLESALSHQKRWGRPLGSAVVALGFAAEGDVLRVLSRQLDVPITDLVGRRIAPEVLSLLPLELAEKYGCIPLFLRREGGSDVLYLGMIDPTDLVALDDVTFHTGRTIRPVLVGHSQLEDALARHYRQVSCEGAGVAPPELDSESPLDPDDTAPLVSQPSQRAAAPSRPEAPAPRRPDRAPQPDSVDLASLGLDQLDAEQPHSPGPPRGPAGSGAAAPGASADRAEVTRTGPSDRRAAPEVDPSNPREVPTRSILRAVTQILIDKGVFSREELMERVSARENRRGGRS